MMSLGCGSKTFDEIEETRHRFRKYKPVIYWSLFEDKHAVNHTVENGSVSWQKT